MTFGDIKQGRRAWVHYFLLALLCGAVIAAINLAGFIGRGQDDTRYLAAIDCWRANGPCLPDNHWASRWPVFAPVAPLFEWFGRARLVATIWPAISSMAALFLSGLLADRIAGRRVALLTVVLLAATPAFSRQFGTISVEAVELVAMLSAALATIAACRLRSSVYALFAGIAVGCGFLVRETAVAWAAMIALTAWMMGFRPTLRQLAAAAVGVVAPIAAEMAVYWITTGNPLFRQSLALHHINIPSTELAVNADVSRSPILNPDIIGSWRREPGLYFHWTIDGPLNLIVNAISGFTLLMAPIAYALAREVMDADTRRRCVALLAGAALQIALINYVFAMDPKPRVFLPAIICAIIALGLSVQAMGRANRYRTVARAMIGISLITGFAFLGTFGRPGLGQRTTERWMTEHRGQIEMDTMTASTMKLSALYGDIVPVGSGKPYLIVSTRKTCSLDLPRLDIPADAVDIIDTQPLSVMSWWRGDGIGLCLLRYKRRLDLKGLQSSPYIASDIPLPR